MNLLFSCIGKRGYIADYFRYHLEKNDQIIGTSNTKWTPGFEHCDKSYVLPDIISPEYIPMVMELCKLESVSGILSFYDPDVVKLSKHFNKFIKMGITPVFPKAEIAEICFDKYKTYKFLKSHNILTAKTYLDVSQALIDIRSGAISFPVFVKPRRGFGSMLTFKAFNERELIVLFNYAPDMIIQEELNGDAINFDMLNDLNGNVISVIPWRKFLSRMGETERSQTFFDKSVIDFGIKLGNILNHIGPLDADLFQKSGNISVLEINLRFGGGYPVSHLAGADFPLKIIKMLKGEKVQQEIGNFKEAIIMMKDNKVIGGPESTYFQKIINKQI